MDPRSTLFLPPPALSGCLFGGIFRDTRGAEMSPADRINHFPASPLVSVSLIGSGELWLLPKHEDDTPLPSIFAYGPTDHPTSSCAFGPVMALTVGIYHDAWLQLGGDQMYSNTPKGLTRALEHFAAFENPEKGWGVFCEILEPIWKGLRPTTHKRIQGVGDWTRAVMTRAALSGPGQSLRSLERRLKRFSGQTRRNLSFYNSLENLHMISQQNTGKPIADIALEAGYSDQSHMGRAVRRATGFSPARLNRAIVTEESFWCYRLLGEKF